MELVADTSALGTPVVAGEEITYTYTVSNNGNVTLDGVAISPTLTDADGNVLTLTTGPDFGTATSGSAEGTLLPGEVATYTATYILEQSDIDAGGVSQTAEVDATDPTGAPSNAVSDDPNDATGSDDVTAVVLEGSPAAAASKGLVSLDKQFPTVYDAEYVVEVTNEGNVTLTGMGIVDDLTTFLSPAELNGTPTVTVSGLGAATANPNYDGVTDTQLISGLAELAPGETATVTIGLTFSVANGVPSEANSIFITASELPEPLEAEVEQALEDVDGDNAFDLEESSTEDRDGDGIVDARDYDPTGYFYCEEDGRILSGGDVTVSGPGGSQSGVGTNANITIVEDGSTGFYQWYVTSPGTYTMNVTYPSSGIASTNRLETAGAVSPSALVDVITGTTTTDPRVIGSGEFGATGELADFSEAANPSFYFTFDIQAGDPAVFNNNIPLRDCAINPADVGATKAADRSTVEKGGTVVYTLTFDNDGGIDRNDVNIVDTLPVGMLYLPESATVNGVQVEPSINGRRLTWTNQDLLSNGTTTIVLTARVSTAAELGDLTNRTVMIDPVTGQAISNEAKAVVRLEPEHVFDCSDVIGKVFDDRNGNGYQDKGETGLAGVRVVGVNGDLITTDQHGRFNVPCASLPEKIGSNFILKVDERSLPSGYRVTTENPRVVRVTPGKSAKINFGAGITDVVDVELSAGAFVSGTAEPVDALKAGVGSLVRQLEQKPSVLRLNYTRKGESRETARQRLDAVEKLIRSEWRKRGRFNLNIERTVKR
ncbi:hypothetical protein COL8621_03681 [Actibacterium lipolyticum]|uniref:Uncharacterized protein n=1 Tax=Actibacterium lipolyticum TaxID=1524263 RepID=A0A238L8K8_9RHOB|nr:hypothetical protein COL8621_03681 [Actibacterium lipolyticum]